MAAADDINRIFREFTRYTGDGLSGAPTNAPLPIGDPQSGTHSPKKSEIRSLFGNLATTFEQGVSYVQGAIPAVEAARDQAIEAVGDATQNAEAARDLAIQAADQAAVVGAGDVPTYPSRALAASSNVPAARTYILLAGHLAPGDGGQALYKRVASQPAHQGKFQSSDGAWWELAETTVNPLMFGATGDNVTDDRDAIQKAIDFGAPVVDGLGRNYRVDTGLTVRSDLELRNIFFNFSNAATGAALLSGTGTMGAAVPATAIDGKGGQNVTVSPAAAATLPRDTLVRIASANRFDTNNTNTFQGEFNIIRTANGTTGALTVFNPLQGVYSSSPTIRTVAPLRNLRLLNVGAIGKSADDNGQKAVVVVLGQNVLISHCRFEEFDDRAVMLRDTINSTVRDSFFLRARTSGTGYGVSVADASQDIVVQGNHFQDVRHSFTTNNSVSPGGVTRRITFSDNSVFISAATIGGAGGDAIDTHGAAEDIQIIGNTITGASGNGINVECRSAVVANNAIRNAALAGISVRNETDFDGDIVVIGNKVDVCGDRGIYVYQGTRGTSAVWRSGTISGNTVIGAVSVGIVVTVPSTTAKNRGFTINGNTIVAPGSHGILAIQLKDSNISGNTVLDVSGASNGIRLTDCISVAVGSNTVAMLAGSTSNGILVTATSASASSRINANGNSVAAVSATLAAAGISFDNNTTYSAIFSNNVRSMAAPSLGTGTGNLAANNLS